MWGFFINHYKDPYYINNQFRFRGSYAFATLVSSNEEKSPKTKMTGWKINHFKIYLL